MTNATRKHTIPITELSSGRLRPRSCPPARSCAAALVISWVATERKKGRPLNCKSARARIALAKQLRDDLSLPRVVPKLKQKKILL